MDHFRPEQEHFGPMLGYCDHQILKLMVRKLRRYDVSPIQCRTLTFLSEQPGDVPQKTLQEYLRVKPSTVNGIVERLEEKHLLTRSVAPGDGRRKLLHLTEEGRCFYQEFIAIMDEVHRQAEQGFSPEELALLQELLHRVADNLTRETEEPSK